MSSSDRTTLLGPLLKGVSRSFYLTLRILPAGMREPVGLAYLLARAADTIADTSLIAPEKRLQLLLSFRDQVQRTPEKSALRAIADEVVQQQRDSSEKVLLESLEPALSLLQQFDEADRKAIRGIVSTLTEGMEFDLRTFPDESSGRIVALREFEELDRYTYMVAGCVGEFWTKMTYSHAASTLSVDENTMIERGVRLGKALQMTNVLRDCGKDLRIGRCYLPEPMLSQLSLTPQALLLSKNSMLTRPVLFRLIAVALNNYREGLNYTTALPTYSVRLRLACLWPIMIGLETLLLLVQNENWLDPEDQSKITRKKVYRLILRSLPMVVSNRAIYKWGEDLIKRINAQMKAVPR
jgi:farnesyl-diphosphate farnesyltransferase